MELSYVLSTRSIWKERYEDLALSDYERLILFWLVEHCQRPTKHVEEELSIYQRFG